MNKLVHLLVLLSMVFFWNACVDDEFDEPPVNGQDPNLEATHTIAEIKMAHQLGQLEIIGEDVFSGQDVIVEAVVISDDTEGNFFRQIYIQDETGGLEMRIDATNLSTIYPPGRRVFVRCNGLWLGDFNSIIQFGFGPTTEPNNSGGLDTTGIERIPEVLLQDFIVPGTFNNVVTPRSVTLDDLSQVSNQDLLINYVGSLVEIADLQFIDSELGLTLADAVNNQSENRTLESCDGLDITIRTSGFADFAGADIPAGNGPVTGVLGIFDEDGVIDFEELQITIRDMDDLSLTASRCTVDIGGDQVTISSLREAFAGGASEASGGFIQGVVISDGASDNITGQNLVLQDGTAGIVVRFADFHSFAQGQEIRVGVDGEELSEFNGLLQVNNIPLGNVELVGSGVEPSPRVTDIQSIFDNFEDWESTLVRINDVQLSGGGTFSGELTLSDASGDIPLFTRFGATFADDPRPTNTFDIIAIVSQFNDEQLNIRNLDDIIGGMTGGGGGDLVTISSLREAFAGGSSSVADGFIRGVVISDGANLNIVEQNLVIQDGTAGIAVRFSDPHSFELGEELEIAVGGAELSEFNGLLQVNNVSLASATSNGMGTLPAPRVTDIATLSDNAEEWESTLVRINGAELSGNTTLSGSLTVDDGTGTFPMFTRFGATFSGESVPTGEIDIIAIVSEFNDPQLNIRNPSDLIGGGMGGSDSLGVEVLRNTFNGGGGFAPSGFIVATVISDRANGNTNSRNAVVQDGNAGIVVRFAEDHSFDLGDVIRVDVSGMELSEFRALLQVTNVPLANAQVVSSGSMPAPIALTISDLLADFETYESRLISLTDVEVSGATTWTEELTITDASGSIPTFVNNAASFSGVAVPSGTFNLTAIASEFNDPQVILRNLDDIN